MSKHYDTGSETIEWFVEPEYLGPHGRLAAARLRKDQANSRGVIVSTCIFFVLTAGALTFGGHSALHPLMRSTEGTNTTASGSADVLLAMPDGRFCRHISLDNETGQMREGTIERCPENGPGRGGITPSKFSWSAVH